MFHHILVIVPYIAKISTNRNFNNHKETKVPNMTSYEFSLQLGRVLVLYDFTYITCDAPVETRLNIECAKY